jgi:hypothetical protein
MVLSEPRRYIKQFLRLYHRRRRPVGEYACVSRWRILGVDGGVVPKSLTYYDGGLHWGR